MNMGKDAAVGSLSPVEVLVVEDDHETLAALHEVLEDAGYSVTGTATSEGALTRLRQGYRPAAMLVDFRMPDMTGGELLQVCRADPALAGIPAILISCDLPSNVDRQGIQWFLQKPFTLERVLAVVGQAASGP